MPAAGHQVVDFGGRQFNPPGDYPDFIVPLARAVAANKVAGVRAGLIHDVFSAHQGVEDDDMNVICLGGRVIGPGLAMELIETFLTARFSGAQRHWRRLAKLLELENRKNAG